METLLNLFVSIVSQPAILVSLIALLGLVLQKRNFLMLFRNVENIRRLFSFNWWRRAISEFVNALCGDVPNRVKYTRRGA